MTKLDQESLELEFLFDNPIYISTGDLEDKMKIRFFNTALFLVPEDSDKMAIPNGWELNIMLPPQKENFDINLAQVAP